MDSMHASGTGQIARSGPSSHPLDSNPFRKHASREHPISAGPSFSHIEASEIASSGRHRGTQTITFESADFIHIHDVEQKQSGEESKESVLSYLLSCFGLLRARPFHLLNTRLIGASRRGTTADIFYISESAPSPTPAPSASKAPTSAKIVSRRICKTVVHLESSYAATTAVTEIRRRTRCSLHAHDHGPSRAKRIFVVINPSSGTGRARHLYEKEVGPALRSTGFELLVTVTEGPGHAKRVASEWDLRPFAAEVESRGPGAEFLPGHSLHAVLCIGGDGTVHEVLQGLMSRPDCASLARLLPLVLLPAGSGNGLSHAMGIRDAASAVMALIRGKVEALDIFRMTQPLSGFASHGFLSLTYGTIASMRIGSEPFRRWLGSAGFSALGLREVLSNRSYGGSLWVIPADDSRAIDQLLLTAPNPAPTTRPPSPTPSRLSSLINPSHPSAPSFVNAMNGAGVPPTADPQDVLIAFDTDSRYLAGTGPPPPPKPREGGAAPGGRRDSKGHVSYPGPPFEAPWVRLAGLDRLQVCVLSNLRSISGDALVAPKAQHNDGLLHLVLTKPGLSKQQLANVLLALETGAHVYMTDAVAVLRVKALALEPAAAPAPPTWLVLDGEAVARDVTVCEVKPRYCRTIVLGGN